MTLHLNLPGSHRNTAQQEDLREARRQLKEKIRSDWDYPSLPAHHSSGKPRPNSSSSPATTTAEVEDRIAGFRFHTPPSLATPGENGRPAAGSSAHALGLDFEPTGWRAREDGSEDDDDTEGSQADTRTGGTVSKGKKTGSAVQFEGPDSVATELAERRLARKRKRMERLEEEVQWNDGLAHWLRRRDIWCCARPAEEVRVAEEEQTGHTTSGASRQQQQQTADSPSASPSSTSSPRSSTSSTAPHSINTPVTTPSTSPPLPNDPPSIPSTLTPLLLPIPPPLLPSNPIRARITSTLHPEIYSKIILQSRTPSVPINLQVLVTALVQGWMADGEWPPKPGVVEKSIGRKKGSGTTGGEGGPGKLVKAGVKKVLRLTGVGGGGGEGGGK